MTSRAISPRRRSLVTNSDEPIPGKGERLGEFEIPGTAADLEIADILQRFHVDVEAEVLKTR